jgi:hypothetical protein
VSTPAAELRVSRYLRKGIAVDSGLLILLIVGRYDKSYIPEYKITSSFFPGDFELLANFVNHFRKVIVSPHVVAELSNHSFKIPQRRLSPYLDVFIRLMELFEERFLTKEVVLTHPCFKQVGVTDTGLIISCLEGPYFLLTIDHTLRVLAEKHGVDAMHFNELRGYSWFEDS